MTDTPVYVDPEVWAACTECGTAWVLRRSLSFSKGWIWCWCPDCKCGQRRRPDPAPPQLVTAGGPYREVAP